LRISPRGPAIHSFGSDIAGRDWHAVLRFSFFHQLFRGCDYALVLVLCQCLASRWFFAVFNDVHDIGTVFGHLLSRGRVSDFVRCWVSGRALFGAFVLISNEIEGVAGIVKSKQWPVGRTGLLTLQVS
jgi:hypothetical protein